MNINYELYRIFYFVVINGNISKAAKALYISQPAVTQSINNLEKSLNGKLFIRTKKGIILTDEGKILFEYIEKGINSFKNGENAFLNYKNLDSGNIRIGSSATVSSFVLMPKLRIFHEKYPKIEINITNGLTKELVKSLRNGDLDLLVVNLPMYDNKDLKIISIQKVQDIFVGNKYYYDLTNGEIELNDLKNYPLIFQKSPSNTREFLNSYLKNNNASFSPQNEIVSYNLVIDFVKNGFGIGYATREFLLEEIRSKELYEIKVNPKIPNREIGIVILKNNIPNYTANKLIEIMSKNSF